MTDASAPQSAESLRPAVELAQLKCRFPNESDTYRQARNALLAEEIELRRHIERVAAQRRQLPPGGEARRRKTIASKARTGPSRYRSCSAGTIRSSPTTGCSDRSASGLVRCAPRS